MTCCNHDCKEGRACPLRTSNGGEKIDCAPIGKIENAAGFVLAIVTGVFLAVALVSWWSS